MHKYKQGDTKKMLKCEINKKENKVIFNVEGTVRECTTDLSILIENLLKSGLDLKFIVAALVNAVNDDMKQDEYNQCCEAISDLLKAIKNK